MHQPNKQMRAEVLDRLVAEWKSNLKPRRPDQRQYTALVNRTGNALDKLANRLASGKLSVEAFADQAVELLEVAHASAISLGRRRAGDPVKTTIYDAMRARMVMVDEAKYFKAWALEMRSESSVYRSELGKIDAAKVAARSRNYLPRMRGSANAAFIEASPSDFLFDWVMLNSEHCADCPRLQAGSPYTAETLPSKPGDGRTECRHNCGCVLVRYDGVIGFARPGFSSAGIAPGDPARVNPGIPIIDLDENDPRIEEFFLV